MSVFLCLVLIFGASCASIDEYEEIGLQSEESTTVKDTPRANTEKNPIQEWFENLSKDTSANAQNTMNTIKDWIANLSKNPNPGLAQNLPTMYMGSFQLLKMPMPQFSDVIKGMGDLATLAQGFNKVTGGLPLPQGLPLISQG